MPRFSICVPTRNRPEHLKSCLDSIYTQTFPDYEVIVQDNSDTPAIGGEMHLPVGGYQFNRRVLAMAANWEAAVARATGDYVLVVADDDALYPCCLEAADRLLQADDLDALRWGQSVFRWPDESNGGRGLVEFPAERGYMLYPRPVVLAEFVLRGYARYGDMPMICTGCVRRQLLDDIRRRCGGRLFPTKFPDVWSGMAVCAVARRVGYLSACLAVCGSSATSTGAHLFASAEGDPVCEEFRRLNDEAGLYWHSDLPTGDLNPLAAILTDTYLWVRDLFGWPERFPDFAVATPAMVPEGWFAPGDVLGVRTAIEAAAFCHQFTRGVPPEVVIAELKRRLSS